MSLKYFEFEFDEVEVADDGNEVDGLVVVSTDLGVNEECLSVGKGSTLVLLDVAVSIGVELFELIEDVDNLGLG